MRARLVVRGWREMTATLADLRTTARLGATDARFTCIIILAIGVFCVDEMNALLNAASVRDTDLQDA